MKELEETRLQQAREALDEAKALRDAGMDASLVLSRLFQAFYYPVIALVHEGRVPETMQSVTIGLFEQRFVQRGIISAGLGAAVRRAFELKPMCCSGGSAPAAPEDLDRVMAAAAEFIREVERVCAS